jgi:hypothetical protein
MTAARGGSGIRCRWAWVGRVAGRLDERQHLCGVVADRTVFLAQPEAV